jgi:hypothetical protein
MKTLSRFISKFTSLIIAVLSCFDRVIFKGCGKSFWQPYPACLRLIRQ